MPRKPFSFEKLDVWQDARRLIAEVFRRTKGFPSSELYGMTAQLNRAALSVANNLAEGSARASLKDQAHFSNQAYSSLMETASDVIIAGDLGFMDSAQVDSILGMAHDLAVRINNLRQSQLRRVKGT